METTTDTTKPSLYVGTYGKYNNGSIKGAWLDLTKYADKQAFLQACAELHKDEADPEFMYQDFEGFPEAFYDEGGLSDKLFEYVALDDDERLFVDEYMDATGQVPNTFEDAIDSYEVVLTDFNRQYEYGSHLVENGVIEIPEEIQDYFDYEAFGRDNLMECSVSSNGYVFRDN